MCYIRETRILDSSFAIRLMFSSAPSIQFHLQFPRDPEAEDFGLVDLGAALIEGVEAALRDGRA